MRRAQLIRESLAFVIFEAMIVLAFIRFKEIEAVTILLILQGYVAAAFSDKFLARWLGFGGESAEQVLRERAEIGKLDGEQAWELLQGVISDQLERSSVKQEVKREVDDADELTPEQLEQIIEHVKRALVDETHKAGSERAEGARSKR